MRKLLLACTALLALTGVASADTFLAENVSVIGGQSVVINSPVLKNVTAGEVHLSGPDGSINVWCLDVFDAINLPYLYDVHTFAAGDVRPGIQVMNTAQVRQIASLMILGLTEVSAAAVQVAIWKVEYGGAFSTLGMGATLANEVNHVMADSVLGGILDRANFTFTVYTDAPSNASQAFGTATLVAVPGPLVGAGMPGLVAAFGGLIALSRHRRRKAA